jgi:hypothetical protein
MPYWMEKLPDMPELFYQVLTDVRNQAREKQLSQVSKQHQQLQRHIWRRRGLQIGIGGTLILWALLGFVSKQSWWPVFNHSLFNGMLGIFGLFLLLLSRV